MTSGVLAYLEKGMPYQALQEFQRAAAVGPSDPYEARLGYVLARTGRRREALKIVREDLLKRKYVSSYDIALVYVGLGEKAQALAWLEKAYQNKDGLQWMPYLKVSPWFDSLRDDPGFQDLLDLILAGRRAGSSFFADS